MKSVLFCILQVILINFIIDILLVQGKYKCFTLSSGNKEEWYVFIFLSVPSPDLCLGKLNLKHIKTNRKLEFLSCQYTHYCPLLTNVGLCSSWNWVSVFLLFKHHRQTSGKWGFPVLLDWIFQYQARWWDMWFSRRWIRRPQFWTWHRASVSEKPVVFIFYTVHTKDDSCSGLSSVNTIIRADSRHVL